MLFLREVRERCSSKSSLSPNKRWAVGVSRKAHKAFFIVFLKPINPMFPCCSRILLAHLMSSLHGPNKVVLDPSCTWIRCTTVSS